MLQHCWQHNSLHFSNQSRLVIHNQLQKFPQNDGERSHLRAGGQVHESYSLI